MDKKWTFCPILSSFCPVFVQFGLKLDIFVCAQCRHVPLIHLPSAIFLVKWSNLEANVPKMLCLADAPMLDTNVDTGGGDSGVDSKKRKVSQPDEKRKKKKQGDETLDDDDDDDDDEKKKEEEDGQKSQAKDPEDKRRKPASAKAKAKAKAKPKARAKGGKKKALKDDDDDDENHQGEDNDEDDVEKRRLTGKQKDPLRDQSKHRKLLSLFHTLPGEVQDHYRSLGRNDLTEFVNNGGWTDKMEGWSSTPRPSTA